MSKINTTRSRNGAGNEGDLGLANTGAPFFSRLQFSFGASYERSGSVTPAMAASRSASLSQEISRSRDGY